MGTYKILKYSDFSTFSKDQKNYSNGILTLNLKSWDEFHNVVMIFNNNPDYIWRGQEKNWPLKASFDRPLDNGGVRYADLADRKTKLKEILDDFKKCLNDLPSTSIFSDDEIWTIGQHYGLTTPLLDWTELPYIAAYFAFYKNKPEADRAIYALNRKNELLILKIKKEGQVLSRKKFTRFISRRHLDKIQDERLKKQRGEFTRALNGNDIKENVVKLYEKKVKKIGKHEDIYLAEILIPGRFKDECLQFLRAANITHGTLFPDYPGAVEICKIQCPVLKES